MGNSRLKISLVVFILLVGVLTDRGECITADELALQVENKYRSFKSLCMDFVRVVRSDIFETESSTQGKMVFGNPDKYRIETSDETIVSDGKFIWTYSAENKQVIKNLADRSGDFFKPYQYLSDFRTNYIPQLKGEEKVDRSDCFLLLLSPRKKDVFIKKMTIWVDKKSFLAKSLTYEDSNDNQVTLTFQHIKANRKIQDSEFIYRASPGVEEVDLSE
jgi:outer membrane lipoprotein carrier protein